MNDLRSLLSDVAGEVTPVDLTSRVTAGAHRRVRRHHAFTAAFAAAAVGVIVIATSALVGQSRDSAPPARGTTSYDAVWFEHIGREDAFRVYAQVAGHRRVELGTVREDVHNVDLSPDGRRLAFWRPGGFTVVELTRGVPVRHYDVPGASRNGAYEKPTWSPDGRTILLRSVASDTVPFDYTGFSLVDIATGASHHVEYRSMGNVAWSPDGTQLALSRTGNGIDIVTTEGRLVRHFGEPGWLVDASHAWSPDGDHLLVGIYGKGSSNRRVVVTAARGEIVTEVPIASNMAWEDAQHVVFVDAAAIKQASLDGSVHTLMPIDFQRLRWQTTVRPAS
jgi:dipeptidyl aminopeptidase/acylaminoacyl peptidase